MFIFIIILGIIIYFVIKVVINAPRSAKPSKISPDLATYAEVAMNKPHQKELYGNLVDNLVSETFLMELSEHQREVETAKNDGNQIKSLRVKFDEEIGFSQKLWDFIEDIKYYKSWYEQPHNNKNGKPHWKSQIIKPKDLFVKKLAKSNLKKLSDHYELKDGDEILEFNFEFDDDNYTLYVDRSSKHYSSVLDETEYYYLAFIYQNDKNLVYQADLIFTSEYSDYYSRAMLDAFKPSKWTGFLLSTMVGVRFEEELSTKEFWDKHNKEQAEKNRTNFL